MRWMSERSAGLRAAAPVDHHTREVAVDDVELVVEVQHRDGGHLARRAARAGRPRGVRLLDDVRVRVLLEEDVRALAGAVVGLVLLGRDDPVPAELDKVHGERVAAAAPLGRRLVAVEPDGPLRALLPAVGGHHLDERHLLER